jgi:hypothetical protein
MTNVRYIEVLGRELSADDNGSEATLAIQVA